MTFQPVLTDVQRKQLCVDYEDGWHVPELSVMYKVSIRTVYRVLTEYDMPKRNSRKKRTRGKNKPKPKELKPCGTNAAYQRHKRKDEYPCTPCLEAHAKDVAKAKAKKKRKRK